MRPFSAAILPLAAALALAGCSKYESSGLRGAGSMRVEVEVYKGPLTQGTEIQLGELAFVMAETVRALATWADVVERHNTGVLEAQCTPNSKADSKFCQPPNIEIEALRSAVQGADEIIFSICNIFPSMVLDRQPNINFLNGTPPRRAAEISAELAKARATLADPRATQSEKDKANSRIAELGNMDSPSGPLNRFEQQDACTRRVPATADLKGVFQVSPAGKAILGNSRWKAPPSMEVLKQDPEGAKDLSRRIAGIAVEMKSKAFRAADANVYYVPRNQRVRAALANFGLIASEYSNQIQARLAVLDKQIGSSQFDRRLLPVSDYLRDASQTDFLRLFDWMDATVGDGDGMRPGKLDAQARIRMAERLYGDYYWEKVNEVYASGQGDVSMAFIKDELGNWNLKSFSNDPAELLASYRSAANAALKAVADLATRSVSAGAGLETLNKAQSLLGLANQIATGEGGGQPAAGGLTVDKLHERAERRIEAKRLDLEARAAKFQTVLAGTPAPAEKTKAEDGLKALPEEAARAVREILADHLATVSLLQESVTPAAAPAGRQTGALLPVASSLGLSAGDPLN